MNNNGESAAAPLVLVLCECRKGQLEKVSSELLGDARKLAVQLKGRCELILVSGPEHTSYALEELKEFARERVHLLEHSGLSLYTTHGYLQALTPVLQTLTPRVLMMPATTNGRDLAPRLAARLGLGYVPNCLTARSVAGKLTITRVSHGGRVHQQSSWAKDAALLLTIKPGVGDVPAATQQEGEPEVVRAPVEISPGKVEVVETFSPDPKTQDLRESERIVSGGRGVGGPEGFRVVEDLADALQASVGASRVAVDLGWVDYARQVGQTGKTVTPELYVAVGISGASHHLIGMGSAEKIVAVNTDPQAPIFSVSHFGTVGDLHEVLPRVAQRIRESKKNSKGGE